MFKQKQLVHKFHHTCVSSSLIYGTFRPIMMFTQQTREMSIVSQRRKLLRKKLLEVKGVEDLADTLFKDPFEDKKKVRVNKPTEATTGTQPVQKSTASTEQKQKQKQKKKVEVVSTPTITQKEIDNLEENFDPRSIINPSKYTNIQHFMDLLDEDEKKKAQTTVSVKSPKGAKLLRISVIGNPNAGKSTMVNQLIGTKLSAVSPKAQTTREHVIGVATEDETQFVFYDTPGVISPKYRQMVPNVRDLADPLVKEAMITLEKADVVLLMIDATKPIEEIDHLVKTIVYYHGIIQASHEEEAKKVKDSKSSTKDATEETSELKGPKKFQCIAILNKKDLVADKDALERMEHALLETKVFVEVVVTSALKNQGLDRLKRICYDLAYEHQWLYDSVVPQMSLKSRVVEIVREKLYQRINKEVPYNIEIFAPKLELTKPVPNGVLIDIDLRTATIGQRRIVIGALKYIHQKSLVELRRLFKTDNVFLSFEVSVIPERISLAGLAKEEKVKKIQLLTQNQRQSYMSNKAKNKRAPEEKQKSTLNKKRRDDVFGRDYSE